MSNRPVSNPAREYDFPADFAWGAATSAYQVEGASDEGGRAPSIWDMFSRQPGKTYNGETGDAACEHYHRFRSDVKLMGSLGLKAYRFSISWSRVIPNGDGAVNEAGLVFYDQLVDELLAQGIEPWPTLYHWDLPYELHLRGGWTNPKIPGWFANYTQVVVDRLSDRVTNWMTINEPQCFIDLGYSAGKHAPGLQFGITEVLRAAHHALLAHGRAVQVIRSRARRTPRIGWAPCGIVSYPATNKTEDIEAARRATFAMKKDGSRWNNTWWYDPVYLGHYPEDGLELYGSQLPAFAASDFDIIRQPLDFFGANIYGAKPTIAGIDGVPVHPAPGPGEPQVFFPAEVSPDALYWGPRFFHERYGQPIVVTENGMAGPDWVALDGGVHDQARIDFTQRYLLALRRALHDGIPIEGYFHWSIMDNFEWIKGYRARFGLIHIDFQTQLRTLKDSALWYQQVIRTNGRSLGAASVQNRPSPSELAAAPIAHQDEVLDLA